jgi:hypothetical protein
MALEAAFRLPISPAILTLVMMQRKFAFCWHYFGDWVEASGLVKAMHEQVGWPYDEDALWYEDRPYVMDERPCDHEENEIKVWKIAPAAG